MKQHTYRVTVEHVADTDGQTVTREPIVFTTRNHDDLFSVVERTKDRPGLTSEQTTSMAIGLKLFAEVVLENRDNPLFAEIYPQIGAFIKKLKGARPTE